MNTDVHCPDCGAITRKTTQDDGTEVLVCTNGDDCARVIVEVLSVPDEGPIGVAAFYSERHV